MDRYLEERRVDSSEIKRDYIAQIGRHILLQQRERIKSTRIVDPIWSLIFYRKKQGRRCSCWAVSDSASAYCGVCFRTGIVGAYDKRGFEMVTLDVTAPDLSLVNVLPYPQSQRSPVPFALCPGTNSGSIYWTVKLRKSYEVDLLLFSAPPAGEACSVEVFCKVPEDTSWVPFNRPNIAQRIVHAGTTTLQLRVKLERTSGAAETPIFSHLHLRHRTSHGNYLVPVDLPREQRSLTMSELGYVESISTLRGWVSYEFGEFNNEDFLVNVGRLSSKTIHRLNRHIASVVGEGDPDVYRTGGGVVAGMEKNNRASLRLKITGVDRNEPMGILTSHDLDLRYVLPHENLSKFPI